MLTFDKKSRKTELSQDLFPKGLKIHNQLTVEDNINYLQYLKRADALKTIKNISRPN